jgi:hypothetical protein
MSKRRARRITASATVRNFARDRTQVPVPAPKSQTVRELGADRRALAEQLGVGRPRRRRRRAWAEDRGAADE